MPAASTVITLSFAAGLMTAGSAQALGFGRVVNATQLGQRLNFGALVRLDAGDTLERGCVFAEVMAGDNLLQPGQVRVSLENGPNRADGSERTVRVTSSTVIEEPVVSVNLTLGCGARSSRRFVVFIDPPGIELASAASPAVAAPADAALLMPQRDESQVAPLVAALSAEPPRPAPRRRETAVVRDRERDTVADRRRQASSATSDGQKMASAHRPRDVAAPGPGAARAMAANSRRPAHPPRRLAAAEKPPAAPRLQLEAPTVIATAGAAATPRNGATAAASGVAPVADGSPLSPTDPQGLLQRERERVQSLEAGMVRLQADADATRQTLAGLQARLQKAEAERGTSAWVYGLAALSAVLALALAALLMAVGRRRDRRAAAAPWWKVGVAASLFGRQTSVDEPAPSRLIDAEPAESVVTASDLPAPASVDGTGPEGPSSGLVSPPAPGAGATPPVAPSPSRAERPMRLGAELPAAESPSVEELIDLEQQVEFFVVLGQDDAAIDLLSHHLRADGANSPLPYLKLLEIHRRRGDRAEYEGVQVRFNRDFNAYAPGWEADLQQGRSLERYPEVVERLQRQWGDRQQVLDLLEALLFRRGGTETTFDLPAYRELLSLYSIACDPAQHARPAGEVDFLLPIGGAALVLPPVEWLRATTGSSAATASAATASAAMSSAGTAATAYSPPPPPVGANVPTGVPLDFDVSLATEMDDLPLGSAPAEAAPARPKAARSPLAVPDDTLETVPSALRRTGGHPDESVFVDLVLEPIDFSVR